MKTICIIPARGGSKGIPNKNIIDFCGKPLIYWSIKQAQDSKCFKKIWVSSDDEKILKISDRYGAEIIKRPKNISGDKSSSESSWLHALNYIRKKKFKVDLIFSPQVTSPLRTKYDIIRSIKLYGEFGNKNVFFLKKVLKIILW